MSTKLGRLLLFCIVLLALAGVVLLPAQRSASASPAAQRATPVAPQPTAMPQPAVVEPDDLGVSDSKVGTIAIPNFALNVYSKRPTGGVSERGPYYHEVWPIIEFRPPCSMTQTRGGWYLK